MSELQQTAVSDTKAAMRNAEGADMNVPEQRTKKIVTGLFLLAIGLAAGWWWGQHSSDAPAAAPVQENEREVLYWYDPMVPQHRFEEPGKSPFMDMQLVPRYADEGTADANSSGGVKGVKIDARLAQNLGLREARVERIALAYLIEASGVLGFNAREVAIEQVRGAGLVERVWPLAPGDVVAQGQPLIELRMPQWSAAQAEYLAVRGDNALAAAARERLHMLGLSSTMIEELGASGRAQQSFVVHSSRAGVLETLDVRSGMRVEAGETLARIQGIDTLWLEVALPESRAAAVQPGGDARVYLAAFPGRELSGRIIAVLPELAPDSRTLRVRIELPNPHGELRAGMSAQVQLAAQSDVTALAVPTEAVIRTGKRALVIAVREQGEFEPVEVQLGPEIENKTVIADGLDEGQRIVSSAQFLLDSEANLSGAFAPADSALPPNSEQTMVPGASAPAHSTLTPHEHGTDHATGEQP
jgi:Cu(I)/Ag(I) efflux system membrane fusion protein